MTREQAAAKYGDTEVMVIETEKFESLYTKHEASSNKNTIADMLSDIDNATFPMLRRDAEFDPSHLQVIPYGVFVSFDPNNAADTLSYRIFTTHRIEGDNRLVGKYSIGIGGHIDKGETIAEAFLREVKEEIGYKIEDVSQIAVFNEPHNEFIYDPSNEVSSVHVGVIFIVFMDWQEAEQIKVVETEKLEGEWLTPNQLMKLACADKLETWSVDVLSHICGEGIALMNLIRSV